MSRHAASPPIPSASPPARSRHAGGRRTAVRRDPLLALAAFSSLGAGVVHAAITPEHRDWWASAAFFGALAVFQIGWAVFVLLRRTPRIVLLAGAAVNLAALGTWLVSRTTGMPFGPHRGEAEPLARADALASLLGALVVLGAIGALRGWNPLARVAGLRTGLTTSAGGVAVSALSIVALTGVSGHAHPPGGEHAAHGDAIAATASTTDRGTSAEIRALTACSTEALALADSEVRVQSAAKSAAMAEAGAEAQAATARAAKAAKAVKAQKRALAECRRAAASAAEPTTDTNPDVAPPGAKVEPHDDSDGHSH